MTDWLGHLIANWPLWLVIPALIIAGFLWFFIYALGWPFAIPGRKYEWPEDKKARLAKQEAKRNAKLKLKKG